MKHRLLLLSLLLTLTSTEAQAISYDSQDGQPRNSWEQQQETYRKHNYDTYRNGPLAETVERERRQENQQNRQRGSASQERNREDNRRDSYGQRSGERCQTSYERC